MPTMTAIPAHTSNRLRAAGVWTALVGGAVLTIVLLHRLGSEPAFAVEWGRLWGWLGDTPVERVLLGLGRMVALVLAYWLGGSAVLATAARIARLPGLVRRIDWLTLPIVRRTAERVAAVTLTLSTLAPTGAALAATEEPAPPDGTAVVTVVDVEPAPHYVPIPAGDHVMPAPAAVSTAATVSPRAPGPILAGALDPHASPERAGVGPDLVLRTGGALTATTERTVRSGDHLWSIAEDHMRAVLSRTPSDGELATYWAHLVDVNRGRLRSGDPNLIFPGEIVTCPPLADVGISP